MYWCVWMSLSEGESPKEASHLKYRQLKTEAEIRWERVGTFCIALITNAMTAWGLQNCKRRQKCHAGRVCIGATPALSACLNSSICTRYLAKFSPYLAGNSTAPPVESPLSNFVLKATAPYIRHHQVPGRKILTAVEAEWGLSRFIRPSRSQLRERSHRFPVESSKNG